MVAFYFRYLYAQLKQAVGANEEQAKMAIFERDSESNICYLKSFVTFHLYISRAPCGDASAYTLE